MLGLAAAMRRPAPRRATKTAPIARSSKTYDSEEVVEKIRSIKRRSVRTRRRLTFAPAAATTSPGAHPKPGAAAKSAAAPRRATANAPIARRGGSTTARRSSRRSATSTIRASSTPGSWCRPAPASSETNHLVIHENETRNVGVIRHNRIIVEKEIRYVRRVPVRTTRRIHHPPIPSGGAAGHHHRAGAPALYRQVQRAAAACSARYGACTRAAGPRLDS